MEKLYLTFCPRWENGSVAEMRINAELLATSEDSPLMTFSRRTVGIPFADYGGLQLSDAVGEVQFEIRDMKVGQSFVEKVGIYAARPITGPLRWSYTVYPRILPDGYTSSPYFDFRAEPGGINSSGLTFLMLPEVGEYNTKIRWDMTDMPEGAQGVWSLGTGDTDRRTDVEVLRYSYYATGTRKSRVSLASTGLARFLLISGPLPGGCGTCLRICPSFSVTATRFTAYFSAATPLKKAAVEPRSSVPL